MNPIQWAVRRVAAVTPEYAAESSRWLAVKEEHELCCIQNPERRAAGLAVRWLAKRLLLRDREEKIPYGKIEILSRDEAGRHVRPRIYWNGQVLDCRVSVAHSQQLVMVGVSPSSKDALGVDVVPAEPLRPSLVRTWFSPIEQYQVQQGDAWEACRIWAMKEAVYKAVNQNEPFRPRQVEIRRLPCGKYASDYGSGRLGKGGIHWWHCDEHIVVLVADRSDSDREQWCVRDSVSGLHPIMG
jgi:phosphopantetheinyl transferase